MLNLWGFGLGVGWGGGDGVIGVGGGALGGEDIVTGTSLGVSKKAPATHGDFYFFPKKPPILKIQVGFFPLKKVFEIFCLNTAKYL